MKPRCLFVLLCMTHIGWAQAEIYKSVDADGQVIYSNSPTKGAKKLNLESHAGPSQIVTSPSTRMRSRDVSPSDFPKVDTTTQKNRDGTRRKILEDELTAEGKLLAEARQNLKENKGSQEIPLKKIRELQEQVSLHEKNVDALKSELNSLK